MENDNPKFKYDLHVHSKFSYDSFMDPIKIIHVAKKKGLDGIAITDHNTIEGGLTAYKANNYENFQVIVGSEIKTEYGDVLGLYLNEEIKDHSFYNVLDDIKSQGGISILAHPYRQYKDPEKIIDNIDLIEGFNARSKSFHNIKALKLAEKNDKSLTAGSDAHMYFEVAKGAVFVENDIKIALKKGYTTIEGNESNYYMVHGLSVLIEKFKLIY